MPCNGGNYFGSHSKYKRSPEDKKKIDVLTRRLCHACQILEDNGVEIPKELDEWWYEHKMKDQERIAEAKSRSEEKSSKKRREEYLASVKKRVMGQLTDDEREALGLS